MIRHLRLFLHFALVVAAVGTLVALPVKWRWIFSDTQDTWLVVAGTDNYVEVFFWRMWSSSGFPRIDKKEELIYLGTRISAMYPEPFRYNVRLRSLLPSMGRFSRINVGVPTWVPALVLAAYPAAAFIRGPLRRYRRRRKGMCVKCAYDLTGNVSGVCPECGTSL